MHKVALNPALVAQLKAERGGRLHLIDKLVPERTAHIVIDMQNGFLEVGAPVEVPMAREVVPQINRISSALREAGGNNVFVQFTTPPEALTSWSTFYARMPQAARIAHQQAFEPGAHYWQLWPELDVGPADARIEKQRFGAFIPGTCDLDAFLRERGIDTLIITGTLTNCCCESTARDAMQLNYRVIFATDANGALSDAEHNATLHDMCFLFGDVMSTEEIVGLLAQARVETVA